MGRRNINEFLKIDACLVEVGYGYARPYILFELIAWMGKYNK
jgi:hypothetical protein